MQRPRRTSEFHEEPGTANKRQSRLAVSRFTVGLTPIRAVSRSSARQTTSNTGSATRGRTQPTPQKTPLVPSTTSRSLFSAEKKRNAAGVYLHNDKKWIQDQTQRITEYLRNAYSPGAMANVNEEFFSRSNCLKQMSIKQFVGIINFFLQSIAGNRLTVGTNYVEDIVNIMQKLNYPYPVNKSWLKTPNTTHSFGNVIVLLDFFMDFVPESSNEIELESLKPDDPCPDLEFKEILLKNCQKSFQLWDKQLNDEFERIKRETADILIRKRHNLDGVDTIEAEISSLLEVYNKLKNDQPNIEQGDENHCKQLRKRVKSARAEVERLVNLDEKLKLQMNDMLQKKALLSKEVAQLEIKTAELQLAIKQQDFDVKTRNSYAEKIKYLLLELESQQQSLQDLQNRFHNKKAELSCTQKKVTDQIAIVNNRLRDLVDVLGITDDKQQFHVAVQPDIEKIQRLGPLIQQLRCQMKPKLQQAKDQLLKYEREFKEKNALKLSELQPEFETKTDALEKSKKALEMFEQHTIEESRDIFAKNQELENKLNDLKIEKDEFKIKLEEERKICHELEKRNEEVMSKFEEEHKTLSSARLIHLQAWESGLNECFNELDRLNQLITDNQKTPTLTQK